MPRKRDRDEIVNAASAIYVRLRKIGYELTVRQLRDTERKYLARARTSDQRQYVRRCVARMLFYAAVQSEVRFLLIASRFEELCRLGFDLEYSEVLLHSEYAECCRKSGRGDVGVRVLRRLQQRLQARDRPVPTTVRHRLVCMVKELIGRLKAG